MEHHGLANLRIHNQYISNPEFKSPEDVVKRMLAIQAQDYAGAKWAIGLRMQKANDALIEKAITDGEILRTHLLRPTWHFVSPGDIRWLLALTGPRINAINAGMYKKFELDTALLNNGNDVFAKALQGNKQLTRTELVDTLNNNGIPTDDLRFTLLLMHAELDAVICSGARIGKQFTYALLDERAPATLPLSRQEALTKLAGSYFNTRGPATIHDFAAWCGLTIADCSIGLENVKQQLVSEVMDGKTYWMPNDIEASPTKTKAYLLPAYDEFAIAYKNRDALVNLKYLAQARHVIFDPIVVVDNQVVGNWKRTIKTNKIDISLNLYGKLNKRQHNAVEIAAKNYQKFME
jgi:hypothetical protein